jgi:hypothetical protein
MSWETVRDEKSPCACGQGYVRSVSRSDDWNRTEENVSLHCEECKKKYVIYSYDYHSSGMIETASRWVKRDDYESFRKLKSESEEADLLSKNQITEHLRIHYLDLWMYLFQDVRRNKKAVWSKLRELGINGYSYALFCKKVDLSRLDEHIESYVHHSFTRPILKILAVNDENIEILAASPRAANDRFHEARRKMFKGSFN